MANPFPVALGQVLTDFGFGIALLILGGIGAYDFLLVAGVLLVVLGVVSGLTYGSQRRRTGDQGIQLAALSGWHAAFGLAFALYGIAAYSFFIVCRDPGGCREIFSPYWPLVAPGLVATFVGFLGIAVSRQSARTRGMAS